jgi:hypothetical protein
LYIARNEYTGEIYRIGGPAGGTNPATDNGLLKCQRAGGRSCRTAILFLARTA